MPTYTLATWELQIDYTPIPTSEATDWYEWRKNAMKTFLERVQTEITGDTSIATYLSAAVVVQDDNLDRFDIDASMDKNLIVIHSPRETVDEGAGGSGRDDHILECGVTAYVRNAKGLDSNNREVLLLGDATAAHPGTLEIIEDLQALFTGNYLSSGGVRYVWDMRVGPIEGPEDLEAYRDEISKATLMLAGHKWDYLW